MTIQLFIFSSLGFKFFSGLVDKTKQKSRYCKPLSTSNDGENLYNVDVV